VKKLPVIFLLLALLTWTLGYHLLLEFHQFSIRAEMHRMIRSGMVQEAKDFIFPADGGHSQATPAWADEDEFSINGKMYDVMEKKIAGDCIVVRAIADEKETTVLAKIAASWNENERDNRMRSHLVQLLSNLFIDQNDALIRLIKPSIYHFIHFQQGLPGPLKLILTPPPQGHC
jgi:hypothetical protein